MIGWVAALTALVSLSGTLSPDDQGFRFQAPDRTAPSVSAMEWSPARVGDRDEPSRPEPVRLVIPTLQVDSTVVPLGVDAQGQMEIPENGADVGWYSHGAAPGASGSAVLAAHVDTHEYGPGVFYHLDSLDLGSTISIEFNDGSERSFRVLSIENKPKSVLNVDDLFNSRGKSLLRLVTCGGAFDPNARSYEENIIVTARETS